MKRSVGPLVAGVLWVILAAAAPAPLRAAEYALEELWRLAVDRSPRLKLAEESLFIAETGRQKALSFLLPRVTATGGYTRYSERKYTATGGVLQPESAYSWGVRVEETVSLSGRELMALEISRQNVDRSRQELFALRDDYLLRFVAVPFYNVLLAQKNLEIADANLRRLQSHRDAAEKRLRIGEVTKTALLRAEGELSGARSEQLQAKNGLELARASLASHVGITGPYTLRETPPAAAELPALARFAEQAEAARPDLRSLEIQKRIAADQILFAEGASWPSVSLFGAYAGAEQVPAPSNLNREGISAGIQLNIPLFDGGLRRADVAEAKARDRQAALQIDEFRKGIDLEVTGAYLEVVTQQGGLRYFNDQLRFARDNYHAVERQFGFGLANSLDVMDANTLLVSAERKAAQAAYSHELSLLRLKKAAGAPLAEADGERR